MIGRPDGMPPRARDGPATGRQAALVDGERLRQGTEGGVFRRAFYPDGVWAWPGKILRPEHQQADGSEWNPDQ